MNKLIAGLGCVAALSVFALSVAPAQAQETGPDTAACAQANAAVLTAAIAANTVAQSVDSQQAAVLAGLKAAVESAKTAVNTANTAFQAAQTAANLAALVTAQNMLKTALANLADGPQLAPAQKAVLDEAQAKVAAAIAVRLTACTSAPATTTPTTTATPTTTTTAAPSTPSSPSTVIVRIPSAIDTGYAA